jgi:hypothetical protein
MMTCFDRDEFSHTWQEITIGYCYPWTNTRGCWKYYTGHRVDGNVLSEINTT